MKFEIIQEKILYGFNFIPESFYKIIHEVPILTNEKKFWKFLNQFKSQDYKTESRCFTTLWPLCSEKVKKDQNLIKKL